MDWESGAFEAIHEELQSLLFSENGVSEQSVSSWPPSRSAASSNSATNKKVTRRNGSLKRRGNSTARGIKVDAEHTFGLDWGTRKQEQEIARPANILTQMSVQEREVYLSVREGLQLDKCHLMDQLVACADAVSKEDLRSASLLMKDIRLDANQTGNPVQRVAFYFLEALGARMDHTGASRFLAICSSRPSTSEMLKSVQLILQTTPYLTLPHFFSNKAILEACKGHQKVHIVDFGLMYGYQWPAFFQLLKDREDGPLQVRLTGIDLPQPGFRASGRVRETGRRLKHCAKEWGVEFKFNALSCKWENVEKSTLGIKDDEVLIINCMFKQTNLFDQTVIAEGPKDLWLNRVRSLNPKAFIQCLASANLSNPFFIARCVAALAHHVAIFASMDKCISSMEPGRIVVEQDKYGREIMNIVACEMLDRVERSETYKQWETRSVKAGLETLDLDTKVVESCMAKATSYHTDFGVTYDKNWILLDWKGFVIHAYSTWKPR